MSPPTPRLASLVLIFLLTGLAASQPLPEVLRLEPGAREGIRGIGPQTSPAAILERHSGGPGEEYRGADFAAYLRAGKVLLEEKRFEWAYARLWPPGQALVSALAQLVNGQVGYLPALQIFSVLLWTVALAAVCRSFRGRGLLAASLYCAGIWWAAPHLAAFNFGLGVLMSESVSTAFFIIGLAVLARDFDSREGLALAGTALGGAALTRPYYEFVLLHPLLLLGTIGLAWSLYRRRRGAPVLRAPWATALLAVALWAQATTVPWRIYRVVKFGSPSLTNFDQLTNWAFATDQELPDFHHSGNAACHADPDLCELVRANRPILRPSLVKKFALMTALTRPMAWARVKWANLGWLWYGCPWGELPQRLGLALEGTFLLGLFFSVSIVAVLRIVRGNHVTSPVELAWVGFVGANLLGFYMFQFEWRYTHCLRTAAYLIPLMFVTTPGGIVPWIRGSPFESTTPLDPRSAT